MKSAERQDLVNHYLEKRKSGMDFSTIRKELIQKEYSASTVQMVMDQIESEFISSSKPRSWSKPLKAKLKVWFGGFLFVLGIIVTVLSFTPYSVAGHQSIWIGHILSGSFLFYIGKRELRKLQSTGKRKFETNLKPEG